MKKFLFVLLYFLFICNCFAQVTLHWKRIYEGPENVGYYPYEMAVDDSGNVFITGTAISGSHLETSYLDFSTIKYNSNGDLQWSQVYGIPGYIEDDAYRIAIDSESNVYVTGMSYDTILNKGVCATIKYNSSGVLQWVNSISNITYGWNNYDNFGLDVDNHQNVYVIFNGSGNDKAAELIKYNSNGSLEWRRRYGGVFPRQTNFLCLKIDEFGYIYVGGINFPRGTFVRKFDPQGNLIWIGHYHKYVFLESMDVDSTGSAYTIGGSYDSTRILRFSNTGNFMWVRVFRKDYNNIGYDYRKRILIGRDSKILSTFPVIVSGDFNNDIYVLKLNSYGETIWQNIYARDSSSYEYTSALREDDRGDVYVSGYSYSNEAGINDTYVILQYNSSGETVRVIREIGTEVHNRFYTMDMVVDKNRNIIITGYANDSVFYDNGLTFKLVQPVGVTQTSYKVPTNFKLYQSYPNPFNPNTKIKFQISKLSDVKMTVYDIIGREVATLVNEKLKAGSYEVKWDGAGYPSGVYFYQLKVDDYVDTKKMLLIK